MFFILEDFCSISICCPFLPLDILLLYILNLNAILQKSLFLQFSFGGHLACYGWKTIIVFFNYWYMLTYLSANEHIVGCCPSNPNPRSGPPGEISTIPILLIHDYLDYDPFIELVVLPIALILGLLLLIDQLF